MKKNDLNSFKVMFYLMNVFNERNICGFFFIKLYYNYKFNYKFFVNYII